MPLSISRLGQLLFLGVLTAASAGAFAAGPQPKTVCTITVNSPDEREVFRRNLPPGDYRFVELVQRGRKDWLAAACEQKVSCDALVISGHFDGGDEFYTDSFDASEFLTVLEMEKASCSDSCPGVFAHLKEVYLFGCNTLKPEPHQLASSEIDRALLRSGHTAADAARLSALLGEQHTRSNRDRMRHIFKDVPVIYGFSSKAPLGRYAGPLLDRWFQGAPAPEVGSGNVNAKLLSLFGPSSMTVTAGLRDSEPQAAVRADACRMVDERLSDAQKVAFVHQLLQRDMAEVRMFLDELERFSASMSPAQRTERQTAAALGALARDQAARDRYLAFARDADEASIQVRMMALARSLGWLTAAQEQTEFVRMVADRMQRSRLGRDEVDLACGRRADLARDPALQPLLQGALANAKVTNAAVLACLGSPEARARVVRAVTSDDAGEIAIARTYLRHQPLADAAEVRAVAGGIARMPASDAQVRALETLAQQRVADRDSLQEIARMFQLAKSVQVQRAIAGILIRSDHRLLDQAALARSLRQYRLKSSDGDDVIDALIRVLQAG